MAWKPPSFLIASAVLLAVFFKARNYGYQSSLNRWAAEHGENQVHEFLYMGSKWELIAYAALLLGIVSAVLGFYYWFHNPKTMSSP